MYTAAANAEADTPFVWDKQGKATLTGATAVIASLVAFGTVALTF